jgi:hypothetical protein
MYIRFFELFFIALFKINLQEEVLGMRLGLVSLILTMAATGLCLADFQVNTNTYHDQEFPDVAMNGSGNFVVVWRSEHTGSRGIYGQRFDSEGKPKGSEFQISTSTAGGRTNYGPSIAMDSPGNFVVAWSGYENSVESIIARRYDSNGTALSDEFVVNSHTHDTNENSHKNPSAAMNASGAFVIVWEAWHGDDSANGISSVYGRKYNSEGVAVTDEFLISQLPYSYSADVDITETGDFVAAWFRDGDTSYINIRMYNSNCTPKGDAIQISNNLHVSNLFVGPSIAMDGNDNFIVDWAYDPNASNSYDVWFQRFDAAGTPIGTTQRVNTKTSGYQWEPSAAMNQDGKFVITWWGTGVSGRRYNSNGISVGDEFQIPTYAGTVKESAVAIRENGAFVAVWQSNEQDGSEYGIFGRMSPVKCCADFDDSGITDFHDFCVIAEQWLQTGSFLEADLIDDDKIDELDLNVLSEQWLRPCHEYSEMDLYKDGIIDLRDFCVIATNWLSQSALTGDITGNGIVDMQDVRQLMFYWLEEYEYRTVELADYWPFAVGNLWVSSPCPDAGFSFEIADKLLVNGFDIWQLNFQLGSLSGGSLITKYYVYLNGNLYSTPDANDLSNLPEISGQLNVEYPENAKIGVPVDIPGLGAAVPLQGTLSSVLENTGYTVSDFPLGDRQDVLAFVPVSAPQNVVVFGRSLGPMRLNIYPPCFIESVFLEQ